MLIFPKVQGFWRASVLRDGEPAGQRAVFIADKNYIKKFMYKGEECL